MQAQDFLVELGTEELPPKALKKLAEAFLAGVESGLKDAGLGYAKARYYAAPRRLAFGCGRVRMVRGAQWIDLRVECRCNVCNIDL